MPKTAIAPRGGHRVRLERTKAGTVGAQHLEAAEALTAAGGGHNALLEIHRNRAARFAIVTVHAPRDRIALRHVVGGPQHVFIGHLAAVEDQLYIKRRAVEGLEPLGGFTPIMDVFRSVTETRLAARKCDGNPGALGEQLDFRELDAVSAAGVAGTTP
eukprot:632680-Prymnesium_polylepis.1